MPRDQKLDQAQEAAEKWIGAALLFGHICRILEDAGQPEPQGQTRRELILQMAHFQYGTELSYSRLLAAHETMKRPSGVPWSFAPLLAGTSDAHQLLVFAAGFWRTLRRLCDLMPFRELEDLLSERASAIRDTQCARNHIEHIAERIVEGRRPRRGAEEMPRETFQAAIGRLEFPEIVFGSEAFNLEAVATVVLAEGLRVSVGFRRLFEARVEEFNADLLDQYAASG